MDHFKYKDFTNTRNTHEQQDDELVRIATGIINAILDSGTSPAHHKKILWRHRSEWPFLWEKLDALIALHDKNSSKFK